MCTSIVTVNVMIYSTVIKMGCTDRMSFVFRVHLIYKQPLILRVQDRATLVSFRSEIIPVISVLVHAETKEIFINVTLIILWVPCTQLLQDKFLKRPLILLHGA